MGRWEEREGRWKGGRDGGWQDGSQGCVWEGRKEGIHERTTEEEAMNE